MLLLRLTSGVCRLVDVRFHTSVASLVGLRMTSRWINSKSSATISCITATTHELALISLRYGVPVYRFPKNVDDRACDPVGCSAGAKILLTTHIGRARIATCNHLPRSRQDSNLSRLYVLVSRSTLLTGWISVRSCGDQPLPLVYTMPHSGVDYFEGRNTIMFGSYFRRLVFRLLQPIKTYCRRMAVPHSPAQRSKCGGTNTGRHVRVAIGPTNYISIQGRLPASDACTLLPMRSVEGLHARMSTAVCIETAISHAGG